MSDAFKPLLSLLADGGTLSEDNAADFFDACLRGEPSPAQVGAAVGRTDRAMRTVQALGAREVLDSIWAELGRHRQPKLHPEHAGPIAKYLVEHPRCTQPEVAEFIAAELSIVVDTQTLRRFLDAYSLDVLRPARAAGGGDVSRPT